LVARGDKMPKINKETSQEFNGRDE